MPKILLLEDVATDAELVERALRRSGLRFESRQVADSTAFEAALGEFAPDVVLSDYNLPGFTGLEALRIAQKHDPSLPVIVVTGALGDEAATELIRAGAKDYVLKDRLARLPAAVERALAESALEKARKKAEAELGLKTAVISAVQETTLDGILVVDVDGKVILHNRRFEDIFRIPPDDMATGSDQRLLEGAVKLLVDPEAFLRRVQELYAKRDATSVDELQLKDGRVLDRYSAPVRLGSGEYVGRVWFFRDITARKLAEQEVQQRERNTRLMDDLNAMLLGCNNRDEAYPLVAMTARQLFDGSSGSVCVIHERSRDLRRVAQWGSPGGLQEFRAEDCWALRLGRPYDVVAPDARPLCKHFEHAPKGPVICQPLAAHGDALALLTIELPGSVALTDTVRSLAGTFGQMIALSLSNLRLRETLQYDATHDALTGLYNRQYLVETLGREAHRALRNKSEITVAILDIDHFKDFNDAHGHDAGDLVLRELGSILRNGIRASDLACRYGGEEFLLMLPDAKAASGKMRVDQLRRQVAELKLSFDGRPLPAVTVSAGIAELPGNTESIAELITLADRAMYAAKAAGRDRSLVYAPGMNAAVLPA